MTRDVDGGIGRHLVDLAEGMVARGWDVHCVRSDKTEGHVTDHSARLDAMPGVTVHPIPMRRAVGLHDLRSYLAFRRVVKRHGPFDIAHGHGAKGGVLARLPCPEIHARVYTPHAFITLDRSGRGLAPQFYFALERFFGQNHSNAVILVSEEELREATRIGIRKSICHVVHNGIKMPAFMNREKARIACRLPIDSTVILFVGRFTHAKAPERFVDLLSNVSNGRPLVRGLMIGSGNLESDLKKRARDLAIESSLQILESQEASRLMRVADVLVVPSRYEGLSYTMIEGLSASLPIVSLNVSGASHCVVDGENGYIVKEGNLDALAHATSMILDSPKLAQRMSKSSRKKFKFFCHDSMINRINQIYRNLSPQNS